MKAMLGDVRGEGYAEIHRGPYGMTTVKGGFKPSERSAFDREDLAVGEQVPFSGVVYERTAVEVMKGLEVEITAHEGDTIKFAATEDQHEHA